MKNLEQYKTEIAYLLNTTSVTEISTAYNVTYRTMRDYILSVPELKAIFLSEDRKKYFYKQRAESTRKCNRKPKINNCKPVFTENFIFNSAGVKKLAGAVIRNAIMNNDIAFFKSERFDLFSALTDSYPAQVYIDGIKKRKKIKNSNVSRC